MGKKATVQPEISIGLIGHVDHGKTSLVKALSGKWADTHSEEIKRGITIRLGYADISVYKCAKCKEPEAFSVTDKCVSCGGPAKLVRAISLVDAPGHESLMATMLCGANIMDGALLMIAANEKCPQPQTLEHLQALEIVGIEKLIVVQNKVDLVTEEQAEKNYKQIKEFLSNSSYADAPIIPMSATHGINLDVLLSVIEELVPTPKREVKADPSMLVARSFDINKPGSDPQKMLGGVLGGMLRQGMLKSGQEIEVLPGVNVGGKQKVDWRPLKTKIVSIHAGNQQVKQVGPGGSFAILTGLDPSIVKSDQLVGSVVGSVGKLPPVWNELLLETHLLDRAVGTKDKLLVDQIKKGEVFMLNVNSAATVGIVRGISKKHVDLVLKRPVCAQLQARVTISRRMAQRWRLIGYGIIVEKKKKK
ncbi:translation initiation factor IF-2 subunit gamma [Candidatus Woesearchaeota archaeon]|nr:translation initiation factor IF-2 subunit gamma [Candidatus Woesearchaeota archaeon]